MVNRVLVPLDGSELAEQVLPYVRILARSLGAKIELLRTFQTPAVADFLALTAAGLKWSVDPQRKEAEAYLEQIARELKRSGLDVETNVRSGPPSPHIANEAEKVEGTTIAMSTHQRSCISRWTIDSVSDKVLHATNSPILLVPGHDLGPTPTKVELKRIIVPLDGSDLAEGVLPRVVALAKAMALKVSLLRVTPAPGYYYPFYGEAGIYPTIPEQDSSKEDDDEALSYLKQIGKWLRHQGVTTVDEIILHGDAASAIVDLVHESEDVIVAMTTHGRGCVSGWVLGRVADRVVRHSGIPVLLAHSAQQQAHEE